MRAKRALKEGVVIRKRQGEPWFPLLLCARRPRRPQLFPRFVKTDIGTPPRAPYRVEPALLTVSSGNHAHRPVSISPKIEQYSRHRTATHCPG